jgi:hypothetical protein
VRVVRYVAKGGEPRTGILRDGEIVDAGTLSPVELIAAGTRAANGGPATPLADVTLLAPAAWSA